MKQKKVIITQSNYIPWKGYFDGINEVDELVLYDDMQYTKRDWRNRNKIKTPQGLKWVSVPVEVSGKYFQKINETKVADVAWGNKHWDLLVQNYKKAPHFNEVKEWIAPLYLNTSTEFLSEINQSFIEAINRYLGINTPVKQSSEFTLAEGKTERLLDLCKQLGATDYYSGPAAKDYLEEGLFNQEGITVHYFDYSGYPEYEQLYSGFEHGVTILDLLFQTGKNAPNFMKTFEREPSST